MDNEIIEWNKKFELGVADIDFQHHYFLNLINRINEEIKESDHEVYNHKLIEELYAYTKFHFISEENMMLKANYPDLPEHKRHHFELINELSAKSNRIQQNTSVESINLFIRFLLDWFFHHTAKVDKKFADYLNGH